MTSLDFLQVQNHPHDKLPSLHRQQSTFTKNLVTCIQSTHLPNLPNFSAYRVCLVDLHEALNELRLYMSSIVYASDQARSPILKPSAAWQSLSHTPPSRSTHLPLRVTQFVGIKYYKISIDHCMYVIARELHFHGRLCYVNGSSLHWCMLYR